MVGFLVLFGIATDDGVVRSTYLDQRFYELKPTGVSTIREAVVEAGCRRPGALQSLAGNKSGWRSQPSMI